MIKTIFRNFPHYVQNRSTTSGHEHQIILINFHNKNHKVKKVASNFIFK